MDSRGGRQIAGVHCTTRHRKLENPTQKGWYVSIDLVYNISLPHTRDKLRTAGIEADTAVHQDRDLAATQLWIHLIDQRWTCIQLEIPLQLSRDQRAAELHELLYKIPETTMFTNGAFSRSGA